MIWFVYGEPRTGKSLFGGLVDAILPAIKRGRRLYTNIPLIRLGICTECHISVMEYNRLVNPIKTLQDIFQIYDNETTNIKKEFLDTVFVIDEFRALKGLTPQTENYFTRILNVVSKSAVDFILIAQLPTYFESDTRDLGRVVHILSVVIGWENHTILLSGNLTRKREHLHASVINGIRNFLSTVSVCQNTSICTILTRQKVNS